MPAGSAYQGLILPAPRPKPVPAAQGGHGPPILIPHSPSTTYHPGAIQSHFAPAQAPSHGSYSSAGLPPANTPQVGGGNMAGVLLSPQQTAADKQAAAVSRLEQVLQLTKGLSQNPFMAAASPFSSKGTPVDTNLQSFLSPQQQTKQRVQAVSQFNSALSAFGQAKNSPVSLLSPLPAFASTIKFPAGMSSQMRSVVSLANSITKNHFNYEWGGGHGQIGVPGSGSGHGSGPGVGFDCSGAVSAILHAAGLLNQPKVASEFMSYGQPGPGTGKNDITIYASPTHTFANIGGKFFGTSGQNPGGGAAWFQANPGYTAGFVARHVTLPAGTAQKVLARPTLPAGGKQLAQQFLPGNVRQASLKQYAQPGARPAPLNAPPAMGGPQTVQVGNAGTGQQNHVSVILGAPLSDSQKVFSAELAKRTGLDPGVIAAWVHSEQPPSGLAPNGAHNWLNVGATDSGFFGAGNPAWQSPKAAADFTAKWLRGTPAPGFGTAAPGIQAVLSTARQGPAAQIAALQHSGWAGSGYPQLAQVYNSIAGTARLGTANVNIPAGSGGSSAAPSGGGGGSVPVAAAAGGSAPAVAGGTTTTDQAVAQALGIPTTGLSTKQQAQQQLLQSFLSQSSPWDVGPKTSGLGGGASGSLPPVSQLPDLALASLQSLAGGIKLTNPRKKLAL